MPESDFFHGYEEVVQSEQPTKGMLTLCPTPIGNLGDMTFRAYSAIRRADILACEDTRLISLVLKVLPKYKGGPVPSISTFPKIDEFSLAFSDPTVGAAGKVVASVKEEKDRGLIVSFTEENQAVRTSHLIKAMKSGLSVALASSTGTPLLASPGGPLVASAIKEGIIVDALPGPVAAIVALTSSGFPCENFLFEGYLPRESTDKEERLRVIKEANCSVIVYESSAKLVLTLAIIEHVFGPLHRLYVGQDLTKPKETHHSGPATDIVEKFKGMTPLLGEFTIVVPPVGQREKKGDGEVMVGVEKLVKFVESKVERSPAERRDIVAKLTGLPRSHIAKLIADLRTAQAAGTK